MKKSKKTIIYMLIALFVAVSVVFVDFSKCYASSEEGFTSTVWRWFKFDVDNNTTEAINCPADLLGYDQFLALEYKDNSIRSNWVSRDYEYRIDRSCFDNSLNSACSFKNVYSSDTECIAVLCTYQDFLDSSFRSDGREGIDNRSSLCLFVISKSELKIVNNDYYYKNEWKYRNTYSGSKYYTTDTKPLVYYSDTRGNRISYDWYELSNTNYDGLSLPSDMKFFDDIDSAYTFIDSGDASGATSWDTTPKQTYSSELAFTSFDMSVHDSNSFDDYYLEFLYKCPDEWLGKNPKLVINQTWDYNVYYFDNKGTSSPLMVNGSNTCALSVSGDRNSIKIPLGQLDCLKEFVSNNLLGSSSEMKRRVLGNTFSSPGIAYKDFVLKAGASCNVDKSFLSLSCVVYVDGVAGHEYVGSVDLITGDNSMATYTPDSSGNYTFNDDYKKGGHYYTNVGKDAAGNTTYNYYYYTTDNSKHEVTSQDSHDNTYTTTEAPASGGGGFASGDNSNNNVNNPTFNNNNNITIEGDTINNDVNNIVGNNTSSETNKNFIEKFLGFFQLLENNSFLGVWGKVFGWLPPGISSVITTALGIGACVGLFRFFRR